MYRNAISIFGERLLSWRKIRVHYEGFLWQRFISVLGLKRYQAEPDNDPIQTLSSAGESGGGGGGNGIAAWDVCIERREDLVPISRPLIAPLRHKAESNNSIPERRAFVSSLHEAKIKRCSLLPNKNEIHKLPGNWEELWPDYRKLAIIPLDAGVVNQQKFGRYNKT